MEKLLENKTSSALDIIKLNPVPKKDSDSQYLFSGKMLKLISMLTLKFPNTDHVILNVKNVTLEKNYVLTVSEDT